MNVEPGRVIGSGRYSLLKPIGQGGMASVFLAFDERLHALRAVKVLKVKLAGHPRIRQRFESEARTMAGLRHPNILAVHDVGAEDELVWIVMDLAEHGSLEERVQRAGPLAPGQAAGLVRAVVSALGAAHKNGVIHRDIKPQNILLGSEGEPLVTDFGIARVTTRDDSFTRTGTILGTLAYMAPEQKTDPRSIDGRADLYAAGAMLFAILTGEKPFDLYATEAHETRLAGVPEPLAAIIRKSTRFRPEDRYQDANAFKKALDACLRELPHDPLDAEPLVDPDHAVLVVDPDTIARLKTDPTLTPVGSETLDTIPTPAGGSETFVLDGTVDTTSDLTPPAEAAGSASVDSAPAAASTSLKTPVPLPAPPTGGAAGRVLGGVALLALLGGGGWVLTRSEVDQAPVIEHGTPTAASEDPEPSTAALPVEDEPVAPAAEPSVPEVEVADLLDEAATAAVGELVAEPEPEPPPVAAPVVGEAAEPVTLAKAAEPAPDPDPPPPAEPEPEPEPELGRVAVTGDAERVRLVGASGSYAPGEVPAGSYAVRVTFPGAEPFEAMSVEVAGGASLTINCNAAFSMCGPE